MDRGRGVTCGSAVLDDFDSAVTLGERAPFTGSLIVRPSRLKLIVATPEACRIVGVVRRTGDRSPLPADPPRAQDRDPGADHTGRRDRRRLSSPWWGAESVAPTGPSGQTTSTAIPSDHRRGHRGNRRLHAPGAVPPSGPLPGDRPSARRSRPGDACQDPLPQDNRLLLDVRRQIGLLLTGVGEWVSALGTLAEIYPAVTAHGIAVLGDDLDGLVIRVSCPSTIPARDTQGVDSWTSRPHLTCMLTRPSTWC